MSAVRGVIFYLMLLISLVVYTIPCLIIGPFLPIKKRYSFFLIWGAFILWSLRIVCGVRHEVTGMENIPSGNFIMMSNHQSPWETFFLYDRFRPLCAILKKELLSIPFFGWGLRLLNPIAIDRSQRRIARKMVLEQGKQRLESGLSVLIFPEGTRVDAGKRKKFSVGGTELAIAAGATIVPVAHNAGYFWPAKKLAKNPGTISVVIGKPVSTAGQSPRELTQEIQGWIHSTMDRLETDSPNSDQTNAEN